MSMRSATTVLMLLASIAGANWTTIVAAAELDDDAPLYVLILDRSGSMNEKDGRQLSRWQRLQKLTADFAAQCDLRTKLHLIVFDPNARSPSPLKINAEGILDTESAREVLQRKFLSSDEWPTGIGVPTDGQTPLYLSIKIALERAIENSSDGKHRPIIIRVYSDGGDQYKIGTPVTLKELCDLCKKLTGINRNARGVFVPIGADHFENPLNCLPSEVIPFDRSIPIQIRERQVELTSPVVKSKQQIQLTLSEVSEKNLALLKGKEFTIGFIPPKDQSIRARILGSLKPQSEPQHVTIEVTNAAELRGDQEYHGELKVSPPGMPGYGIDGLAHNLSVRFQKAAAPEITGVEPKDGTIVLDGQSIVFRVYTLQDATVEWDFGDGSPHGQGHMVTHRFKDPGPKMISVLVTDHYKQSVQRAVNINVINAGLRITSPTKKIFERVPCELECSTWGGVRDLKWRVSGESELLPAKAAGGDKASLAYKFPVAGSHYARVQGTINDQIVRSDEIVVNVVPVTASLKLAAPETQYRKPFVVTIDTDAPIDNVSWKFGDPRGQSLAETRQSATHEFRAFGSHPVSAELTLVGGEKFCTPEVFVNVIHRPAVARGDVLYRGRSAPSARRVRLGSDVELKNECDGDLDSVEWTIKRPDGTTDVLPEGTKSMQLADLGRYTFTLRATGPDQDGKPVNKAQVITFAVRPRALHEVTGVVGALMLAIFGIAIWRSLGNGPAKWRLAVHGDREALMRMPYGRPIGRYWRKMSKTARLPIGDFVTDPYFKTSEGKKELLTVKTVRSPTARGALSLNTPDADQRLAHNGGGTIDYQLYDLTYPRGSVGDENPDAKSDDTSENCTHLKLLTDAGTRWEDVAFATVALIVCIVATSAAFFAVENWTGRY